MAEHSAGHDFLFHPRGGRELQQTPESSSMKPQEEYDPQGSHSHLAFTDEPEPSHSAFTNEPELTKTHDHDDAMIDLENAAAESQEPLTSNTAAGRRDGYLRCHECLRTHLPPCNASQKAKDLLKRDPEEYKRKFNTDRKKRNRKNRSAREPPPPVCGTSRVSRPAHAYAARRGAPTGRQNSTLPFPTVESASPAIRAFATNVANTAQPNEVAHIRALLAPNNTDPEDYTPTATPFVPSSAVVAIFGAAARTAPDNVARIRAALAPTAADPENRTRRTLSRFYEDQLAEAAEEASAAEENQG